MKLSGEERRAADRIPNVKTWAKTVPHHAFRLPLLDVYLFKQNTPMLTALGYERATVDNPGWDWRTVAVILRVVIMFAPVAGFAAYGGPIMGPGGGNTGREFEGFEGETAVTVVMWSFIVALAGPVIVAYRWWRHQRHWAGVDVVYLVSAVVLGGICLANLAGANGVDVFYPEPPSVPVWLTALSAVVLLVVTGLASQGRYQSFGPHFRSAGSADPDQIAELVAGLWPKEREKLLERRCGALAKLLERDLIDQSRLERVRSTPLGMSVTIQE